MRKIKKQHQNRLQNTRGFTLVELLMALLVFSILMSGITGIYVIMQRYWTDSSREIRYQSAGRMTLKNIERAVRRASKVTITESNAETRMVLKDISGQSQAYIFNKNNRSIDFDDNVNSGSNDERPVLSPVAMLNSQQVFRYQGAGMAAISFRVVDPDVTDGTQGRDFSLQVSLRN